MHQYGFREGPRYPVTGRPSRPPGAHAVPRSNAAVAQAPAAVTGRPALTSLTLALAFLGLVFIIPAPLAAITGWLAMRGRGAAGSSTYRMARLGFTGGLAVTAVAAIVAAVIGTINLLGI